MSLNKKSTTDSMRPPASSSLMNIVQKGKEQGTDQRSQVVQVPIDEVKAIGMKVSPTYELDDIQSVTLKSFRKVVGYDTFNSILKKDRDEQKDTSDFYNVTVSMMVRRKPQNTVTYTPDKFEGGKTLSDLLDKGFPYDDNDVQPNDVGYAPKAAPISVA